MGNVKFLCFLMLFIPLSVFAEDIKSANFAGTFYPAEKRVLEETIDAFLKEAKKTNQKLEGDIIGILSPHAGYMYSGRTMAHAYIQLERRPLRTIIILGPSHRYPFNGIAIYSDGGFDTPLGTLFVDKELARKIMTKAPFVKNLKRAFDYEHSIEVQIPFLQKTMKNVKIVPFVFGMASSREIREFSHILSEIMRDENGIAIVASSDMSHYHSYEEAKKIDLRTLRMIEEMDLDGLTEALKKGNAELCGSQALLTVLSVTKRLSGYARVLFYETSGDTGGDREKVVGYGATIFYREKPLKKQERLKLISIARRSIEEYLEKGRVPIFSVEEESLKEKRGVFVTLTKKGELRGCIGFVFPTFPLYDATVRAAIGAATQDPRFKPLSKGELKDIEIEISVLSPLRRIRNVTEIEMGKEGLFIVKGDRSGLLLPQVAKKYGLSREEFLKETLKKAGLDFSHLLERDIALYAFRAEIFSE